MEYLETYEKPEYHKIMRVSLALDGCSILKGPQDEKQLMEFLEDDVQIGRYRKMLQLVVREKIEESAQERVLQFFSPESLKTQFKNGETKVTCSYFRKVNGQLRRVTAAVYPRSFGKQGELKEFMIYIFMENV